MGWRRMTEGRWQESGWEAWDVSKVANRGGPWGGDDRVGETQSGGVMVQAQAVTSYQEGTS